MTVSYTAEVATCKGFGCFLKLLFRWRGSIYKLVWLDLVFFLGIYFALSVLYRFLLTFEQQIIFEKIVRYCEKYGNLIPVSFVLGFYVSIVVRRWWDQYKSIPWPDSVAVFVSANIQGQDEKGRVMRRTIMRYCCLTLTMTFTLISPRVKRRFPTLDHLVEAGLLLENEKDIIDELNQSVPSYSKHWLPIVWASSIVTRARKEGKIRDDSAVKSILEELNKFRSGCGILTSYDWISVPLVYTQVVTLAVYSYFLACIMGRQWLRPERKANPEVVHEEDVIETRGDGNPELDLIFPIFTTLQFFFYMGWLKVAESLVNPFGDDDDDFELNWIVDRNLQVSYLIVDEMHNNHPELLRDQYWDEVFPPELPHTVASEQFKEAPPSHSTANICLSTIDEEIVSPPSAKDIFHMSESGIFMRPSIPKTPTSPDEELLTLEEGSPVHHNNAICKGHPHQLSRAGLTFPLRMDDAILRPGFMGSRSSLSKSRRNSRNWSGYFGDYLENTSPHRHLHHRYSGTRLSIVAPNRGNVVERRARTASAHSRPREKLSEGISIGRLRHAGSTASVFKRIFSQDGWRKNSEKSMIEVPGEGSGDSTSPRRRADVIPELDENTATILSMRIEKKYPRVQDIFRKSPPASLTSSVDTLGNQNNSNPGSTDSVKQEGITLKATRLSLSAPPISNQERIRMHGSSSSCCSVKTSQIDIMEASQLQIQPRECCENVE